MGKPGGLGLRMARESVNLETVSLPVLLLAGLCCLETSGTNFKKSSSKSHPGYFMELIFFYDKNL